METLTKTDSYINNQYFGLYKPIKWLNMITEKQLKIFDVFAKKPFAQYTRKEIKEESKEKSLRDAANKAGKEEKKDEGINDSIKPTDKKHEGGPEDRK